MKENDDGSSPEIVQIRLDGRFEGEWPKEPLRSRSQVVAAIITSVRDEFPDEPLHLEVSDSRTRWNLLAKSLPQNELIEIENRPVSEALRSTKRRGN